MKSFIKNFVIIFVVLLVIAGGLSMLRGKDSSPEIIGIATMVEEINAGKVKKVAVEGDTLRIELVDSAARPQEVKKEPGESFGDIMENYGVSAEARKNLAVEVQDESAWKFWAANLIPAILPLIIIIVFFYFMTRGVQGMNQKAMGFGQSNPRQVKPDDKDRKTFADVAGAKEAKAELEEVVEFLRDQKKFVDMGAKIPKGVLLMGAPGTGKTLLAKAVAGEANVPFFHMSGSEFVEMFVGVGASRVRDLFGKAKRAAPAIVFIDEIDAVGRRRGAGLGGGHDEREQTLNQILVEMDGFDPNLGVIVMAATNRPDVLDPALLRPGRFDRRVTVDMPDIKDREEIIAVHSQGKPLSKDVTIRRIAERTPGFSGADLANLMNEAAIVCVRRNKKEIGEREILDSIEKVLLGPERKSRVMSERDKKTTAYHEAGHAVVGYLLPNCDPIRKISVISRGSAGGYTLKMPTEDKHYHTLAQFKDDLAMAMGGYVAEKMIFGDDQVSTGPSSDLRTATKLARNMVTRYGMSELLGPRTFGEHEELVFLGREIHEERDYSDKTAEDIDKEIRSLVSEAETRARKTLTDNRDKMDKMVVVLMEKETLEQEELELVMGAPQKKNFSGPGIEIAG
ncbi:MAG: cell division protein FtsH [Candidatus Magasanikbacteria bacterium RIFCSPLOWO2_02_FULL_44_11]|uniref:ATP-dependent zinc metalloprotease FtsH n=2 Tax=Candidatus Magasanikiibacteriota TaxID=1752731 RepID=A0A1F6N9C8_9BACT|nr:MAG: cell division protein FtsH [Candidatus Magasanikbacteria bacterium RIFCSPHIGHO2_02_FULL_45_10]OGH80333.1 MAG: cell division protein FtsH [Candidatus Magasanikbacteria bacterium RIFCSPLOWO2_02_FULL_44_11]